MSHDPYDLSSVPVDALTRARSLLREASGNMLACGVSGVFMGWWVESHTLGCRNAADEPEESWWDSHWKIFSDYENDGISKILTDEETGAFVTMTPQKGTIAMGVARKRRIKPTQMKLSKADRLAEKVEADLAPYAEYSKIVGSVRRRAPTVGDIELVVLPKNLGEFLGFLDEAGFHGGERKQMGTLQGMPIEIYIAHDPRELGGLVFMYTGDFTFNIAMRMKAKKRGLKLNQYGIWKGAKPVLQSDDEVDFFKFLGVRYHEPEERSLSRRVKPKKAVRMSGDEWDGEEE